MLVRNAVDYVVGDNEAIDGKCAGEAVKLYGCDPLRCFESRCSNYVPCEGNTSCELDKLCELAATATTIAECLEIIKTNPIAAIDGDLVDLKKCTEDGRPLVFYASTNEITGEVTFTTYVLESGDLIPYTGTDCVECNKQYNFINGYVADTESKYCGYPIYECESLFWILDTDLCEYIEIDKTMPITYGAPTTPATSPECITLTYELCNQDQVAVTVTGAEIVAQALAGAAANSVTWPNGDVIAATPEVGETVSAGPFIAAKAGVPIKLDDGTTHEVSCDYGGICIYPNAGTNGDALSGGGTAPIGPNDSVDVDPGAGGSGCITICRDIDKSGQVVVAGAK